MPNRYYPHGVHPDPEKGGKMKPNDDSWRLKGQAPTKKRPDFAHKPGDPNEGVRKLPQRKGGE